MREIKFRATQQCATSSVSKILSQINSDWVDGSMGKDAYRTHVKT